MFSPELNELVKETYRQALINEFDATLEHIRALKGHYPKTWIQDPLFEIDPSWRREFHYDDCDEDCSCWEK